MLRQAGAHPRLVKLPNDLVDLDGLVLPGGESTTIGKLLTAFGILQPLRTLVGNGLPVYGTCAGMILLANRVERGRPDQVTIGGMDIEVERNAFGRQAESFEQDVQIADLPGDRFHAVFIRAPIIRQTGPDVTVLSRLDNGTPVAAREGNALVSSFHPELTRDLRMHQYFLRMATTGRGHTRIDRVERQAAIPGRDTMPDYGAATPRGPVRAGRVVPPNARSRVAHSE